jgi:CBS domain-containing protein
VDELDAFNPDAVFDPGTPAGRAFAQEFVHAHRSIDSATDAAGLQRASHDIRELLPRVVGQMPAEPLTRLISTLNDALTRRVIELSCAGFHIDRVRWCWLSFGSEGRQEQTLSSDQDNGIIFEDGGPEDAVRAALLPLALRINQALDACGFPLCRGQIMASNPQWCLSLREWRKRFANWIIEGDPQALLNATIFFDLRPLYGAHEMARTLLDWLSIHAPDSPRFLYQMTENALRREPPLGFLRDFAVEKGGEFDGTIDLKTNAATLFIDAARIFGLGCAARTSNTAARLKRAAEMHRVDLRDVDAWIRAFYFVQMLRLKIQQRCHQRGVAMHNHIAPDALDTIERRALHDALRQARALQKELAMAYMGGTQGI